MKRALVLSGGGALGAYQVGMIRELVLEQELDFQILRGVSVGALTAAFLAQAPTGVTSQGSLMGAAYDLTRLWQHEIKGNSSVYRRRLGIAGIALGANSLYDLGPLRKLVGKYISHQALYRSGRDFRVGTVSLVSGEYQEWGPSHTYFMDKLLASMSIPGYFPPVEIQAVEDVLVDGGVRNITPLASAIRAGADEIYVLLASRTVREGNELPQSRVLPVPYKHWRSGFLGMGVNAIDIAIRAVQTLTDEVFLDDLRTAIKMNDLMQQLTLTGLEGAAIAYLAKKRYVPLYILAPRERFGETDDALNFDPALISHAIEHGREIASDPKRWVWPIAP